MPASDASRKSSSPRFGGALRLVLFYLVVVAAILGGYFLFYVDARVEQTMVRNFRALDSAAVRLTEIISNLNSVTSNVAVGAGLRDLETILKNIVYNERIDDATLAEEARVLRESCDGNEAIVHAVLTISSISSLYLRDFDAIPTAAEFDFHPVLLRTAPVSNDSAPEGCAAHILESIETRLERLAGGDECSQAESGIDTQVRRLLVAGPDGVEVEARDCRGFSVRSPDLNAALPKDDGDVTPVLDRYGVVVSARLDGLVDNVAANVAPLFDQYLIADRSGRVIYSADSDELSYQYVTGAPTVRRARLDFVNHVNVEELVRSATVRAPSSLEQARRALGVDGEDTGADDDFASFGVHSRIEQLQIADMTFQAFIHPFQVSGLDALPEEAVPAEEAASGEETEPAADNGAVLFMIGIVDGASLSGESVRLRVSFVAGALLILGLMISLLSLLWLWTGGERIMLKSWHPFLLAATGLTAALLSTLFVLHLTAGTVDDRSLDRALERVGHSIRKDFRDELGLRLRNLLESTRIMLAAGEAPARQRSVKGYPTQTEIEKHYFCRGVSEAIVQELSRYPRFDLAFLLDDAGRQWQCLSYRMFDTRPIALQFREYFQYPRDGKLWRTPLPLPGFPGAEPGTGLVEARIFLQRITSILDGTTESALSARPDHLLCGFSEAGPCAESAADVSSAAIIGRMHSLEETILPPHFRFAVFENSTGRTLFHSVGSLSLASNFVRDVDVDDDLLALVDTGDSGFVDLNYYGSSIRAYVQPLADGVPWTLVTYRGYELADTLNIITVSTAAAIMFGALVVLSLVLLVAVLLDRWARTQFLAWGRIRDEGFAISLLQDAGPMPLILAVGAGLLLVAFVVWLPRYAGVSATISMLLLPTLLAVLVVRRIRHLRAESSGSVPGADAPTPTPSPDAGYVRRKRIHAIGVGLAALATLVVIPTIGTFADVRARLGLGLTAYMQSATSDAIISSCERQTAFAGRYKTNARNADPVDAFQFGWALASVVADPIPADGAPLPCGPYPAARSRLATVEQWSDVGEPTDGAEWRHAILVAAGSFSALGSDIARRSLASDSTRGATDGATLDSLLGKMLGREDEARPQAGLRLGRLSTLAVSLLIGACLFWTIVVSLTDRVLGMRLRLAMLPEASVEALPTSWRLQAQGRVRACVICRSDRLRRHFLQAMRDSGARSAMRADWTGEKLVWKETEEMGAAGDSKPHAADAAAGAARGPDEAKTLYIVENFERFIIDAKARDGLLEALETLSASSGSIVICTRILPGSWLADLTDHTAGDLSRVSDQLAMTARWSQVLGPFDVRRLTYSRDDVAERFTSGVHSLGSDVTSKPSFPQVSHAMRREALANPELFELAVAVVRDVCRLEHEGEKGLRPLALQRFRASAASHFHTIWAASNRGERLQLLTLARGGLANPTQTITLSSLANRGLITTEGAVRLKSAAFSRFIVKDLHHDSLLQWRDAEHGNIWRSIWPPILLVSILSLAFFVSSTPEALGPLVAILAASLGIVPVIGSVIRGMRDIKVTPAAKG